MNSQKQRYESKMKESWDMPGYPLPVSPSFFGLEQLHKVFYQKVEKGEIQVEEDSFREVVEKISNEALNLIHSEGNSKHPRATLQRAVTISQWMGFYLAPSEALVQVFSKILLKKFITQAANNQRRRLLVISAENFSLSPFLAKRTGKRLLITKCTILGSSCSEAFALPVFNKSTKSFELYEVEEKNLKSQPYPNTDPTISLLQIENQEIKKFKKISSMKISAAEIKNLYHEVSIIFSACAAGSLARLLEITADFIGNRNVGKGPLIQYQALSHKLVDIYIHLEKAQSLLQQSCSISDPEEKALSAYFCKNFMDESFLEAAQNCIQLHGARAFQWTHEMNFFFRRALVMKSLNKNYNNESQLLLKLIKGGEITHNESDYINLVSLMKTIHG